MRRMLLMLAIATLILTGCGSGDTTVPAPPKSSPYESSSSQQVDTIITEWKTVAQTKMKEDLVKPETIVEQIYSSTASIDEIKTHYATLTNSGWWEVKRMAGMQTDEVLFLGYEHGTTALVVGAIDASKFGGNGLVVYTLKGTK